MIKVYTNPTNELLISILNRAKDSKKESINIINSIINNVKLNGDKALQYYTNKYDNVNIEKFKVSDKEFNKAKISYDLKISIKIAYRNIKSFHKKQLKKEYKIKIDEGITCWRKKIPIEKVGFYIPGGSAPLLSTVLMLGIPGKLAGCKNIILCTPPNISGEIHPSILYLSKFLGIKNVYKLGGVQAIAAMAYGTESIPCVWKIFGPGNYYVTKAKQIVSQNTGVSIDMPAGPSEIVIIADNIANPKYVASDLLSQSEHDPESYTIILTTVNQELWIEKVKKELQKQFCSIYIRKDIIKKSLKNSKIIVLSTLNKCFKLVNKIAPEHLIINCNNCNYWSEKVINSGSVFIGNYSPVSAGDYATGTNHVLPTNGFSKSYSGLSIDSFFKQITFQKISKKGLKNLSKCITILSKEEGLLAHKKSIDIRLNN